MYASTSNSHITPRWLTSNLWASIISTHLPCFFISPYFYESSSALRRFELQLYPTRAACYPYTIFGLNSATLNSPLYRRYWIEFVHCSIHRYGSILTTEYYVSTVGVEPTSVPTLFVSLMSPFYCLLFGNRRTTYLSYFLSLQPLEGTSFCYNSFVIRQKLV